MEKKEYTIDISQEQADYLQRLGVEVESKAFLMDYMFNNHMNDESTLMFSSVPFKHYEKMYEEAFVAFNVAKTEFENTFLKPKVYAEYGEGTEFNWMIDDYSALKCRITILK